MSNAKRPSTPDRPVARKSSGIGGKIIRLLLLPFFFVFRTVFTFVLLSVISFLIFYFKMHGTPEKEAQYEKIMEAMEQVPSVLGGLAQQAGMGDLAKNLGYEPKPEDAQHSKEMLKNLCAQLDAVDQAEPMPWKSSNAAPAAPREDDAPTPEATAPEETGPDADIAGAEVPDMAANDVPEAEQPSPTVIAERAALKEATPPVPATAPSPVPSAVVQQEAATDLPPDAVPGELEPIIAALKKAKNLETIKERLSVKYVGQHGAGAVLFLDKLLEKDQGLLRLAALESLRRVNTPEALEVLHKHTQAHLPPVTAPAVPGEPSAPAAPASPEAPAQGAPAW